MSKPNLSSEFLNYLASPQVPCDPLTGETGQLPSLNELSKEMGISVASLREQVEVAKALGFVEVRPRTGIRRQPYTFLPAVRQSLHYAIRLDRANFDAFAELRNHIETTFWDQAVRLLTSQDQRALQDLVAAAWDKLRGSPVQIPHAEHRQLHLLIYSRLNNPFVHGLLEAYWEAYEAVGLALYADYNYLQDVWRYHQKMVDAICQGDFTAGFQALTEHKDLLYHRSISTSPENKINLFNHA